MAVESAHCDPDRLVLFLRDDLPASEQTAIESHIAGCDDCRDRLREAAADDEWWEAAGNFLRDDENDVEPLSSLLIDTREDPELTRDDLRERGDDVAGESGLATDARQIVAWLAPTDDPHMLGRLAGYEIAGVIGCGGMGVVLKGFDKALNRYVAIKVLSPHLATSGAARQRFAREAQAAAAVVHENVVAIHGVDAADGLPYLVMPYVRGKSLQRRLDQDGPLSLPEALRIAMQTASGLAAAHAQGLVHRDVKPANILLDGSTERVLITDFGLARAADDASVTHSGVIAGTPHYMSPEQSRGEPVDQRSDLFSLGSVLYAMCTGRPPFRAETSYGILRKVAEDMPRPVRELDAQAPEWLDVLIQRLHAKSLGDRPQTAAAVAELLGECLAHVQQPAQNPLPQTLRTPFDWRSVRWATAVCLSLILLFTAASSARFRPTPSTDRSATGSGQVAESGTEDTGSADTTLPGSMSAAWDDGFAEELGAIDGAVERLDAESLELFELYELETPENRQPATDGLRPTVGAEGSYGRTSR